MSIKEKMGRWAYTSRFLFLVLLIPVLFIGGSLGYLSYQVYSLYKATNTFNALLKKAQINYQARLQKQVFLRSYPSSNKNLQPLSTINLLQEEIKHLQVFQSFSLPSNESQKIADRLKFLTEKNKLEFMISDKRQAKLAVENEMKLLNPVELNLSDIKNLLKIIEEKPEHSDTKLPQILITYFYLRKEPSSFNNESFRLNLKLLQREFNK